MDPTDVLPSLEHLDNAVDTLEETLQPLSENMSDLASKLPLLDKAKLYVLMAYSIESMLFSALRLNAVDAKEHPVFKELTRVRQYFDKIKSIEFPPPKPQNTLNKEAAIRFIRSDLADNKEIGTKLTEMIAKERAKAALKTKLGEKRKLDEVPAEAPASEEAETREADRAVDGSEDVEPQVEPQPKKKKSRKEKTDKSGRKEKKGKKSRAASKD